MKAQEAAATSRRQSRPYIQAAFASIIFVLSVLLFFDGSIQQEHRLIEDTWDAGHLLLFGLLGFVYCYFFLKQNSNKVVHYLLASSLFFVLGFAIELIQLKIGRDFSYSDVVNDLIGMSLGFIAFTGLKRSARGRHIAIVLFVLLVIIGTRNFEIHLLDEILMRNTFPELAGFHNRLELTRWDQSNAKLNLSEQHAVADNYSLEMDFSPAHYATVYLQHFIRDWSHYNKLEISIYNPQQKPVALTLKVYDKAHITRGFEFSDRYNKTFQIGHGQNKLTVALSDLQNAPRQRLMNLRQIQEVSLFTTSLAKPVTLFLTHISLH